MSHLRRRRLSNLSETSQSEDHRELGPALQGNRALDEQLHGDELQEHDVETPQTGDGLAQAEPPPTDPAEAEARTLAAALADELIAGFEDKFRGKLRGRNRDSSALREVRGSDEVRHSAEQGGQEALDTFDDSISRDVRAHLDEHVSSSVSDAADSTINWLAGRAVLRVRTDVIHFVMAHIDLTSEDLAGAVTALRSDAKMIASQTKRECLSELADELRDNQEALSGRAKVQTRNATLEEGQRREASDLDVATAVEQANIPALLDRVKAHLQTYLEDKIGAKGADHWRSRQLKDFRGQMKSEGRSQARQDANIEGDDLDAGPATRRFVKMDAERRSYDPAKESVDTALRTLAGLGVNASIVNSGAADAFTAAASEAAWSVLRDDAEDTDKAGSRARKAAAAAKKSVERSAQTAAHHWKDQLIGKDDDEDLEQAPPSLDEVQQGVRDQVTDDEIGASSVAASYKANSSDDALGWFGHLIDKAVPTTGEALTVSVEVQIPIPNTPGMYILIGLAGSARRGDGGAMMPGARNHRGDDSVEVNLELRFGAGVEMIGFKADASLIFFIRAGAEDTRTCMKAMSYGVYRAVSRRSEVLAGVWAGSSKGTEKSIGERSEIWAAMMEEQVFLENPDAYAELGGGMEARGSLNIADSLGLTGSMRGEMRNHIDRDRIMDKLDIPVNEVVSDEEIEDQRTDGDHSGVKKALRKAVTGVDRKKQAKRDIIEERRQDAFRAHLADDGNFDEESAKTRRNALHGERQKGIVVNATFTTDIMGQSFSFSGTLSYGTSDNWEFEAAATLTMDLGDSNATEQVIVGIVGGAVGLCKTLTGLVKNAAKGEAGRAVSEDISLAGDVVRIANGAAVDKIGNDITELFCVDEGVSSLNMGDQASQAGTTSAIGSSASLKVALFVGNTSSGAKGGLEISDLTTHSLDMSEGGVGINVAYTKSRTLLQIGHDGERSFVEGLGLSSKGV